MARPDRLVACVPALLAGVADTSSSGTDGLARSWQLASSLAALFRPVTLAPGRTLFTRGDVGDAAYVVLAGRVALSAPVPHAPGRWALLDVAGPGRCIGEHSLVVPAPRAARAVALSPCLLARVTHDSLRRALAHRPAVWRAVRSAVIWREPSQLIRVPLLRWLAGGEGHDERIAPLCECWRGAAVAHTRVRPIAAPPSVGQGPVGIGDVHSGLVPGGGPAAPPPHARGAGNPGGRGSGGQSSADESVTGPGRRGTAPGGGAASDVAGPAAPVQPGAASRATLALVPSHGPLPRSLGAQRAAAAAAAGLRPGVGPASAVAAPPLSCRAVRRAGAALGGERGAGGTPGAAFPEDVEEEEWRMAADETADSAVRRAAAVGAGAAVVEAAAAAGGDAADAAARAAALLSTLPLVHAGPEPTSPLGGLLCQRRLEGEDMHSLLLVLSGSASLHVSQEHAAADAAVAAVRAGCGMAEAASRAADGARGAEAEKWGVAAAPAQGGAASGAKGRAGSRPRARQGSKPPRQGRSASTVLTRGDFSGGSTLLSHKHRLAARAEVSASSRSGLAVLAQLPRSVILRWCASVPGARERLATWYHEGPQAAGAEATEPEFAAMGAGAQAAAAEAARAGTGGAGSSDAANGALDEWFFGGMN